VRDEGTAQDVIDMISRYKEANGIKDEPAPTTKVVVEDPGAAAKEADAQRKAKQAAQKLSVVGGKRSSVGQAQDPNDFEAFKEFASQ